MKMQNTTYNALNIREGISLFLAMSAFAFVACEKEVASTEVPVHTQMQAFYAETNWI